MKEYVVACGRANSIPDAVADLEGQMKQLSLLGFYVQGSVQQGHLADRFGEVLVYFSVLMVMEVEEDK